MPPRPVTLLRSKRPRTDAEGGLIDAPGGPVYAWAALLVLTAVEALGDLNWIPGPQSLYQLWIHDVVLASAAVLMLARALYEPAARRAWLAFGAAMSVWCFGTILWSVLYGGEAHPPYPTVADVFWLLWYPLMAAGIVLLIRVRFHQFELHRWMDGVAVTLIALAAGFAIVIQPVAHDSHDSWLATIVDFSYPVLDILLIGAVLGVYGLLAWKPDAMWVFIGLGILATTSADAAFAVQQARGAGQGNAYNFVWTVGAILIAYAAWVRAPSDYDDHQRATGMRAIALALIAQAIAIGIQIYAYFEEVGRSERIVTVIVLVVASVQIILTRPRAEPDPEAETVATAPGGPVGSPPAPAPAPRPITDPGGDRQ